MVLSPAYVVTSTGGCGAGMSEVYILKRMRKRMPVLNCPIILDF